MGLCRALLPALALLLAGCPGQEARHEERPARGDTLVVAVGSDADTLFPPAWRDVTASMVVSLTSPSLTAAGFRDGRLDFGPALARSWEWNEDGTRLDFVLREDARWDDGEPVGPRDVAFTYRLLADPEVASPRSSFAEFMALPDPVEVLGPARVRFHFTRAYDPLLQLVHAGHPLVPAHLLEEVGAGAAAAWQARTHVGHGPFRVASWRRDSEIVLERNEDSRTLGPSRLDRIVLRVVKDRRTRLAMLERGDVDMVDSVDHRDVPRLSRRGDLRVLRRGLRFLEYIAWNLEDPLFADRAVRRALTMAMDRRELIQALLSDGEGGRYGVEAVSTFTPELAGFADPGFEPLPHDPAAAGRLLEEGGWKAPRPGAVREKEGRPFRFALLVASGSDRRLDAARLIQQRLRRVGVEMEVERLDPVELMARVASRRHAAVVMGLAAPLFLDPRPGWRSGERFNFSGFADPRADELMERGLAERDPERALEFWRELARLIHDEQPCTFLYWFEDVAAVHARFRGVEASPLTLLHRVWEWWVPEAERRHGR